MSAITPFNKDEPVGRNAIASMRGVQRFMGAWLRRLRIQGDGIGVSQTGDGTVVLRALPDDRPEAPFRVRISGGRATVAPGYVYTTYGEAPQHVPLIAGVPLNAVNQPSLPTVSNGYIVLQMLFDKATGHAVGVPWSIYAVTELTNVPLIRARGSVAGQDGIMDLIIARIDSGQVSVQNVTKSVSAFISFETVVASF